MQTSGSSSSLLEAMPQHNNHPGLPRMFCFELVRCFGVQDVAVSVVGKYRYFMHSPAEHDSVPVIVDIILVGRTKIITLHSSVWLENLTDRRVAFRLHVPITPLVAPAAARGAAPEQQTELKSDTLLGPLPPGEGGSATIGPEPQDACRLLCRHSIV